MTFLRQLARTELVALAALLVAALLLAVFAAIQALLVKNSALGIPGSAMVVFAYTLYIGCLPVIVFGAPIYAFLRHLGKASWLAALGLGVAPGLALLLIDLEFGFFALICGVFVALATHAVCGLGSNNSFKPKPLRGSA